MDKIKKMTIQGREYNFRMTNKVIFRIDEVYGNYGSVICGIMQGEQFYTNAVKLLSCSCTEKEWQFDELADALTPIQLNTEVPQFVQELYFDYIGIDEEKEDKPKTKNLKAS